MSVTEAEPRAQARSRRKRADRVPVVLTALAILSAVPLAVLVAPNTISVVSPIVIGDLGLSPGAAAGLVRAYGLALPALMTVAPAAVVLALRIRAWVVLLAGLVVLGICEGLAGSVGSVAMMGLFRVAQGAAAGVVLAGTLVITRSAQGRSALPLAGLWSATLVTSFLAATPVLYRLIGDGDWRAGIRPYPWLLGVALVVVAALVILGGEGPPPPHGLRGRRLLLFATLPGALIGGLTVWATFGWSSSWLVVLAVAALVLLFGITTMGRTFGGRASVEHVVVAVATGTVVLPMSGQLVNLVLPGFGGRGLGTVWLPLLFGALAALAAGLIGAMERRWSGTWGAPGGLVVAALGSVLLLFFTQRSSPWIMVVALVLLAAGAALALAASLRAVRVATAGIGLGLCLSAVLAGQLFASTIQIRQLAQVTQTQFFQGALVGGLHTWAVVAAVVLCIAAVDVFAARLSRSREAAPRRSEGRRSGGRRSAGRSAVRRPAARNGEPDAG